MSRKGFSIIEMVVVIILIGLIASIGFPRLRDSPREAERPQRQSADRDVGGDGARRGDSARLLGDVEHDCGQHLGDGVRRQSAGGVGPGGNQEARRR